MHPNDRIQKPFTITLCIYASGSASELKMFMLFLGLSSNLSRYTSYWNNLGVQIVHAGCPTGTTSEFKSFTLAVPLRQTHEFKSFRPVRAEPLSSGLARCHSLEQPQKSNLSRRTGGRGVLPRHPLSSNLPTLEVPLGQPVSTSFSSCLSYWDRLRVHALQADCPIGTTDLEFTFYTLLVPR